MGRFRASEIDNYGGSGGGGFFSLKNDKDVAQVRFLYNGIDDVEGYAVHKVEIDGRDRYVSCLRNYNDPIDACPFCKAGKRQEAKLFVPLYNIDEDKVQIWDRGKKFFQKISSICSRYPNLVSHVFEIERNGKKGDTTTTYEIYEVDEDDSVLEDFDLPDMSGVVLDKSKDDMEYYLQDGQFPPDEEDDIPVRRRGSRRDEDDSEEDSNSRKGRSSGRSSRRTPANRGSRNREDEF